MKKVASSANGSNNHMVFPWDNYDLLLSIQKTYYTQASLFDTKNIKNKYIQRVTFNRMNNFLLFQQEHSQLKLVFVFFFFSCQHLVVKNKITIKYSLVPLSWSALKDQKFYPHYFCITSKNVNIVKKARNIMLLKKIVVTSQTPSRIHRPHFWELLH